MANLKKNPMARMFPSGAPMRNLGEFGVLGPPDQWVLCRVAHMGPREVEKKTPGQAPSHEGATDLKNSPKCH